MESLRFETMPSRPSLQAWAKTVGPSPSICLLKRRPKLALANITVLPNGNYYLPGSDEIIPADMATPSPDDHFHHCTYDPVANDFDPWGPRSPISIGERNRRSKLSSMSWTVKKEREIPPHNLPRFSEFRSTATRTSL